MTRAPISGIEVFLAIVRRGSLRSAARSLGVGAPAVSQQLKALEGKLGVDLFVRTTRSVALTEAGRALFAGVAPAFEALTDAIDGARTIGRAQTGTLRLTLPHGAYELVLAPALPEIQERYPEVRLDLSISEAFVDIVKEGFHAGFRLGDRLTAGMIAVRLTPPLAGCYAAAPSYLAAHGRPAHPRDLRSHHCVRYKLATANRLQDWRFVENGRSETIDAPARLTIDDMETLRCALRDGQGVGWSIRAMIEADLRCGRLETVLDSYAETMPPYYVYYPEQNRRLELLRLFVDFLAARRDRDQR